MKWLWRMDTHGDYGAHSSQNSYVKWHPPLVILNLWEEEQPNGSFMDTWLNSPYIYDIYDTNDGNSMTVMTQVRYKG